MRDIAARICRDYLTGAWKTISAEEIQLKRISGGLSNFLYYVSLPDSKSELMTTGSLPRTSYTSSKRPRKDSYHNILEPREVLLRIYGQTHGESALETMLTESVVFTLLSERRLGPKLHGIFPGGRIEQYIPARALITAELSDDKISMKIAEKMSEIHTLEIPVSKEPEWLFNTINRWLNNVESIFNDNKTNNNDDDGKESITENVLALKLGRIDFKKEAEWLRKLIEDLNYPVVFSHNDLQEGNILFRKTISSAASLDRLESFDETIDNEIGSILISSNKNQDLPPPSMTGMDILNGNSRKRSLPDTSLDSETTDSVDSVMSSEHRNIVEDNAEPELMIIDFEYCAYNYRGFDIANHFLEWTFDYTNEQFPFFYHKKSHYPTDTQKDKFITVYLNKLSDDRDYVPTAEDKNELLEEIALFTLASHLFWGLWAIINVRQEIEFGYWDYANVRITEYFEAKENYLKLNSSARDHLDLDNRRK
ncbi:unnamed protein product [Diamesa serratosioi]